MSAALPARAPGAPSTAGARRRLWFDLHSWIGLKLSLFMTFVCLTGTLATVSQEIDWLVFPEARVTPTAQRASWGEMTAAVQRALSAVAAGIAVGRACLAFCRARGDAPA